MQNGSNNSRQTFSFRGRSMQDAVEQLKVHLGVDAVIVSTRRGRDKQGRFVEISARRGDSAQLPSAAGASPGPTPATGGIRKASAAYAQTAVNTRPAPITSRLADITLGDNKDKPFAERAAWLASQIQQRQADAGVHQVAPSAPASTLPPELMALRTGALPANQAAPAAPHHHQPPMNSAQHAPIPHASSFGPVPHQGAEPVGYHAPIHHENQSPGPVRQQATYGQLSPDFPQAAQHPTTQAASQRYAYQPDVHGAGEASSSLPPAAPISATQSDERLNTGNRETELELARLRRELHDIKSAVAELSGGTPKNKPVTISGEQLSAAISSLDDQVGEIRSLLERPTQPQDPKAGDDDLIRGLTGLGIASPHSAELAERLVRALPDATLHDGDARDMLTRMIADDMICGGALSEDVSRRRMLAFVGPTGVGKTTTIAKVASQARLNGHRVALVTVDTFRMAAVEQLARYAEVLNAPLRIARSPESLRSIITELSEFDTILIDTTGRSLRCDEQVQALSDYFPSGWGGELVLTLACGMREADMTAASQTYSRVGIERLCITKTDETDALGAIYTAIRQINRPLTWTTFGQKVPDDIENARAETWAQRIVAEMIHRSTVAYAV
ncbi:MAG: hypothetical protein VX589_09905 [Myxococcota bacterium]|nr:hypothetical protein [Myxococcota bacterium]